MYKMMTKTFFTTPDESGQPREPELSVVPDHVFKQELITWLQTNDGFVRTTLIRDFQNNEHTDHFISQPIPLRPNFALSRKDK